MNIQMKDNIAYLEERLAKLKKKGMILEAADVEAELEVARNQGVIAEQGQTIETLNFLDDSAEEIRGILSKTAEGFIRIGQILTEAKKRIDHGSFLNWVDREFNWKRAMASQMMLVYERFGDYDPDQLQGLSGSVLRLVASPSVSDAAAARVIEKSQGGSLTVNQAKQIVKEEREIEELEEELSSVPFEQPVGWDDQPVAKPAPKKNDGPEIHVMYEVDFPQYKTEALKLAMSIGYVSGLPMDRVPIRLRELGESFMALGKDLKREANHAEKQ